MNGDVSIGYTHNGQTFSALISPAIYMQSCCMCKSSHSNSYSLVLVMQVWIQVLDMPGGVTQAALARYLDLTGTFNC